MKFTPLALAAVLAAAAAGASLAQPAPGAGPDQAPGAPGPGQWRRPDPLEVAQHHADRLRAILQLRPDQEPALKALVAALQPDRAKMDRMTFRSSSSGTLTRTRRPSTTLFSQRNP